MFNLKDIINTPIHCPTEEDSKLFMEMLMEYPEVKWVGKENISTHKLKRSCGEETCYRIDENKVMRFGTIRFYQKEGYEVIELKDILEPEPESNEPILPKEERFKILSDLCVRELKAL